jgi:hypothetical protein
LKEHACVWRVILLDEENKELGLMNTNTGVVVKLNDIGMNFAGFISSFVCNVNM